MAHRVTRSLLLITLCTGLLAACGGREEIAASDAVLEQVLVIAYDREAVPPAPDAAGQDAESQTLRRLRHWESRYQSLHSRYEQLRQSYTGDDKFVEETLEQLSTLTKLAAEDISQTLAAMPPPGTAERDASVRRFDALNTAIHDRVAVVEVRLGRPTYLTK